MIQMPLVTDNATYSLISNADLAHIMLKNIGEDPMREGLIRTPERFERAMAELTSGYKQNLIDVVGEGIFEAENAGLVSVREIEFFSLCEHHLLPFWGNVSIAYYPDNRILGLSKLARVVDVFAKRLQVQERITREVAESIYHLIHARAVAVKVEAQHMCMMMRGVKKLNSNTKTEFSVNTEKLSPDETIRIWKAID
jgi:GTP cyclohydrolase I